MYRILRPAVIVFILSFIISFSSYAESDNNSKHVNDGVINDVYGGFEYDKGENVAKAVTLIGSDGDQDAGYSSSIEVKEVVYTEEQRQSDIWSSISGTSQTVIDHETTVYEDGSNITYYEFDSGTHGQVYTGSDGNSYTWYGGGPDYDPAKKENRPYKDYLQTSTDARNDTWITGADGSYTHIVDNKDPDKPNKVTDSASSLDNAQQLLKDISTIEAQNKNGKWIINYTDEKGKDKTLNFDTEGKFTYKTKIENSEGEEEEHELEVSLSSNEYVIPEFLYYNWACKNMDDPSEFGDTTNFHDMGNYPVGEGVFKHVFRYYGDHIMRVTCWWRMHVWRHEEYTVRDYGTDENGNRVCIGSHTETKEVHVSTYLHHDKPQDHPFSVPLICLDCPGMTLCIGGGCDCATAENRLCDEDHQPSLHIETHSELVR